MKKPKVLVIENCTDVTGALKSIIQSSCDLREYFDFQFVIPKDSKGKSLIIKNGFLSVHTLSIYEISRRATILLIYLPMLFLNAFRLHRIVKREGISIIHVNDLYNILPVVIRIFGSTVPYVCHIRFLPNRFPAWLFKFWLKLHLHYASRVIAVSQSVQNMLPSHPKIKLIYNELPTLEKFIIVEDMNSQKIDFTFLYISNFMKGKGQDYALEAFEKIHNKLPGWKLRFVGSDMGMKKNSDYRRTLLEKARKLRIFEKTEWVGFTEAVELEYKKADIVLNFSESESFSMTCLEGLFFGRPVIASDCGGPTEIIDNNETGLLVSNRDVTAMAAAMLRLALDEKLLKDMGRRASEKVRIKFSVEQTSHKLKEVYDHVITRP